MENQQQQNTISLKTRAEGKKHSGIDSLSLSDEEPAKNSNIVIDKIQDQNNDQVEDPLIIDDNAAIDLEIQNKPNFKECMDLVNEFWDPTAYKKKLPVERRSLTKEQFRYKGFFNWLYDNMHQGISMGTNPFPFKYYQCDEWIKGLEDEDGTIPYMKMVNYLISINYTAYTEMELEEDLHNAVCYMAFIHKDKVDLHYNRFMTCIFGKGRKVEDEKPEQSQLDSQSNSAPVLQNGNQNTPDLTAMNKEESWDLMVSQSKREEGPDSQKSSHSLERTNENRKYEHSQVEENKAHPQQESQLQGHIEAEDNTALKILKVLLSIIFSPLLLLTNFFFNEIPFFRLYIFIIVAQITLALIMFIDTLVYGSYYYTQKYSYMLLRYILLIATYYIFSKDYKSVVQQYTLLFTDQKVKLLLIIIILRFIVVGFNEIAMIFIINNTNLGNSLGLGLILNFSAGIVVCELDDIAMKTIVAAQLKKVCEDQGLTYLKVKVDKTYLPINQNKRRFYCESLRTIRNGISIFSRCFNLTKVDDRRYKEPFKLQCTLISFHKLFIFGWLVHNLAQDIMSLNNPSEIESVLNGFPITVSSELEGYTLSSAVIDQDYPLAWCALNNDTWEYIQVQTASPEYWTRIKLKGSADGFGWATYVSIQYSYDGNGFDYYTMGDEELDSMVFDANYDADSEVEILLDPDILAKFIRIEIDGYYNWPCLRFEAYFRG